MRAQLASEWIRVGMLSGEKSKALKGGLVTR